MLIVHSSNKSENLVAHLIKVLESRPLSSPFNQEHFFSTESGHGALVMSTISGTFSGMG